LKILTTILKSLKKGQSAFFNREVVFYHLTTGAVPPLGPKQCYCFSLAFGQEQMNHAREYIMNDQVPDMLELHFLLAIGPGIILQSLVSKTESPQSS
jgi:hypothetical protein